MSSHRLASVIFYDGLPLACRIGAVFRSENPYLENHFMVYLNEPPDVNIKKNQTVTDEKMLKPAATVGLQRGDDRRFYEAAARCSPREKRTLPGLWHNLLAGAEGQATLSNSD